MMPHAKGRVGRVTHPFHHLSVFVRPTKKALKEAAVEVAAKSATETTAETSAAATPATEAAKPIERPTSTKKGWWPFGKKEEASL